jgi:hypothetical protein
MRALEWVFETANKVTRAGSRPAALAARPMRAFTACRFSAIVAIMA